MLGYCTIWIELSKLYCILVHNLNDVRIPKLSARMDTGVNARVFCIHFHCYDLRLGEITR
jgi:hypothetical protein